MSLLPPATSVSGTVVEGPGGVDPTRFWCWSLLAICRKLLAGTGNAAPLQDLFLGSERTRSVQSQ